MIFSLTKKFEFILFYFLELGKFEDEEINTENTDLSKLVSRRIHDENYNVEDDTFKDEILQRSMTMEEAKSRIIDPENLVVGGKTSLSMYDYVASDDIIGNEEFLEEKDYYQKQTSNVPFHMIKEGIYEFPTHLDVFIHPDGVFEHFDSPRRSSGKTSTIIIFIKIILISLIDTKVQKLCRYSF